jgi:hypothetical protein
MDWFQTDSERLRAGMDSRRVWTTRMNLLRFEFRDFEWTDPEHTLPCLVCFQHQLETFRWRIQKDLVQDHNDILSSIDVIIMQDHGVQWLSAFAGRGLGCRY